MTTNGGGPSKGPPPSSSPTNAPAQNPLALQTERMSLNDILIPISGNPIDNSFPPWYSRGKARHKSALQMYEQKNARSFYLKER